MTILSYVWVVSMYLSSIYLSLPDEPCWKPQLQQRRRTAEAESGLQNPQILWDQFTSPSSSRELITRASTVRTSACDIQRTFQNVRARHQHCNVQPGANACWTPVSEMDMILTALRETQSAIT